MSRTILFLIVCAFSFNLQAEIAHDFSAYELQTASPFSESIQKRTLKGVLKAMSKEYDHAIPLPKVMVSNTVTDREILDQAAKQGLPEKYLKKGLNMYLLNLNIIVLGDNMKIHNLAHEYAHYIQHMYLRYTQSDLAFDGAEEDAVAVQRPFRP